MVVTYNNIMVIIVSLIVNCKCCCSQLSYWFSGYLYYYKLPDKVVFKISPRVVKLKNYHNLLTLL